ncbi:MAG: energy transducer TonB [Acidobacteriota bacterium]|nr:energy transducer TonB [Acidobacteriota bacterium]
MAIQDRLSRFFLLVGGVALCAGTASADNIHRAIVSRVQPQFPELARRMHVSGRVVLLVTIQPDGSVSATKVESGHALLAPAAQDAVSHWHFAPNPTPSESEIEVNFNAQ